MGEGADGGGAGGLGLGWFGEGGGRGRLAVCQVPGMKRYPGQGTTKVQDARGEHGQQPLLASIRLRLP